MNEEIGGKSRLETKITITITSEIKIRKKEAPPHQSASAREGLWVCEGN